MPDSRHRSAMPDTETWTAPEPVEPPPQSPLDAEISAMTGESWQEVDLREQDLRLPEAEWKPRVEKQSPELHQRSVFLAALRRTGSRLIAKRAACATIGDVARWEKDDGFLQAYAAALHDTGELAIARAVQLGIEGTLEPVFQGGVCVGHKRKFSEKVLLKLLEGFASERFGKKSVGSTTNNLNVTMTPEQCAEVVRRLSPRRESDIEVPAKVITSDNAAHAKLGNAGK